MKTAAIVLFLALAPLLAHGQGRRTRERWAGGGEAQNVAFWLRRRRAPAADFLGDAG